MLTSRCLIGVDLGGTNVRAMAIGPEGPLDGTRWEQPSRAQDGFGACMNATAEAILAVRAQCPGEPIGVGLSIPGHVDNESGVVIWSPNFGEVRNGVMHYWENVPVRETLERAIGLPIVMGNDANCAAMGEYRFGVGRGTAKCLVMLTLGTGVGGGVVLGPQAVQGNASGPMLLVGGNKGGGELGHTLVQLGGQVCNTGAYGPLEAYCAKDAIVTRAINKIRRGMKTEIDAMVDGDWGRIDPKVIADAASAGDEIARQVWWEVGLFLGAGVGSIINVFAPDTFAIGGQISGAWDHFSPSLMAQARDVAIPSLFADCEIVRAEQSQDAGLMGAAALVEQLV